MSQVRDPGDDKTSSMLIQLVLWQLLPGTSIACLAFALMNPALGPGGRTACIVAAMVIQALQAVVSIVIGRLSIMEHKRHLQRFVVVRETEKHVRELFAMTDMLQAAEDHADAGAILKSTATCMLPELAGALYVFNNSRDRLDLAMAWNESDAFRPSETLLPGHCWALKRGKPHINGKQDGSPQCTHFGSSATTLEVPMIARGTVYGLMVFATEQGYSRVSLEDVRRIARALADSMSLALSNIALREKLRTQSLRDPLTGLYNRRYMEDALERYVSLASRSGAATSVAMIDLDNFKRLNDEQGHAKGDAVLRDVAVQLVGVLRPSDIVSRYGGEELVVILPNCGLEDAILKAEAMRGRIEALSDAHGLVISASIGVATVPETSLSPLDVIPMADAALYEAKQSGKNRVCAAARRSTQPVEEPIFRVARK